MCLPAISRVFIKTNTTTVYVLTRYKQSVYAYLQQQPCVLHTDNENSVHMHTYHKYGVYKVECKQQCVRALSIATVYAYLP